MKVIRQLESFPPELRGGVLSIGKFDGVHAGHASILECVLASSRIRKIPSIIFTFDPSPATIIRPHKAPPLLCTTAERISLLSRFKPDALILFPTTKEFLELTADEFFEDIVLRQLGAQVMVEGTDFTFGSNRSGNTTYLSSLCREAHIAFQLVPSVVSLGREVSSSRIRSLVREGRLEAARGMLLRPYRISGFVAHGEHRGRRLGYPTANLAGVETLVPKPGLYSATVTFEEKEYIAAVNIGGNPTFGVDTSKVEVHLLDFSGDLYGKTLNVDFLSRIRDVVHFNSQQELLVQISRDIANVRRIAVLDHRQ